MVTDHDHDHTVMVTSAQLCQICAEASQSHRNPSTYLTWPMGDGSAVGWKRQPRWVEGLKGRRLQQLGAGGRVGPGPGPGLGLGLGPGLGLVGTRPHRRDTWATCSTRHLRMLCWRDPLLSANVRYVLARLEVRRDAQVIVPAQVTDAGQHARAVVTSRSRIVPVSSVAPPRRVCACCGLAEGRACGTHMVNLVFHSPEHRPCPSWLEGCRPEKGGVR